MIHRSSANFQRALYSLLVSCYVDVFRVESEVGSRDGVRSHVALGLLLGSSTFSWVGSSSGSGYRTWTYHTIGQDVRAGLRGVR